METRRTTTRPTSWFCAANHHTQATNGQIDKLACLEIKKHLAESTPSKVDHRKLAKLIAESLNETEWPDPTHPNSTLDELSEALDLQLGAKAELMVRHGERLVIWIQAGMLSIKEAKTLALASGCVASSLAGVTSLEIGFSNTHDFVHSTGGPDAGTFRIRFNAPEVYRVATEKRVPAEFWRSCLALSLVHENRPFMTAVEVPFADFERGLGGT
jgi:hypothetical protein